MVTHEITDIFAATRSRKRRQPGWNGTPSATRTRKSPARASKPSKKVLNKSYPLPPKGERIVHDIMDAWPYHRREV